jgi:hypothetical protein
MQQHHPDSPLLDGAMPYSEAERVRILFDYAGQLDGAKTTGELQERFYRLQDEWADASSQEIPQPPLVHPVNEYEHWNEIEDDVLALISDLLPDPWYATLHPDDPGTVVIWDGSEGD